MARNTKMLTLSNQLKLPVFFWDIIARNQKIFLGSAKIEFYKFHQSQFTLSTFLPWNTIYCQWLQLKRSIAKPHLSFSKELGKVNGSVEIDHWLLYAYQARTIIKSTWKAEKTGLMIYAFGNDIVISTWRDLDWSKRL